MTTQRNIVKQLKSALVNCPPSRLREMTGDAFVGTTSIQLEQLCHKLEVMQQLITNQLRIRENRLDDLKSVADGWSRRNLIKATKQGRIP